jgi:cell division protein FtsL
MNMIMNSELGIVIAIIAAFLSVFAVWIYLNRRIDQMGAKIGEVNKNIGENIAAINKSIANLEADVRELRTDVRWIKKVMEGRG